MKLMKTHTIVVEKTHVNTSFLKVHILLSKAVLKLYTYGHNYPLQESPHANIPDDGDLVKCHKHFARLSQRGNMLCMNTYLLRVHMC